MDGYIGLLVVIFIICMDARALRQEAEDVYSDIMKYSPRTWTILTLLLFIFVAPWYYYRRYKFLKALGSKTHENLSGDKNIPVEEIGDPEHTMPANLMDSEILTTSGLPNPAKPNPFFPLIIEANGVAMKWFLALNAVSLLYLAFAQVFQVLNTKLLQFAIMSEFSTGVIIYFIYRAIKIRTEEGFWRSLSFKKGNLFFVKSLLVPGTIGLILATVNFWILKSRQTEPSSPLEQALEGRNPLSWSLFLGIALLTAPFLEELIFRGYFFSAIQRIKGTTFAIGSITFLFALSHVGQLWGNWIAILLIFGLALCLTLLRAWSGSTVPGIVTHYAYNTSLVLILPALAL
ncbi:MAG: CPBP family intramembrane metalloprotease [Proteobacteria bacterium]|nr:CPBP family intramembrane metalloprotease [Pseudomonadota bacterium]MBU4470157.1 CPBP family intramembrane metalloprotease [Pseudomonadota bacterium]MCG2753140.1 CPBP family intramembrane metalloprotease [Desulfobacteraceae bacterium]